MMPQLYVLIFLLFGFGSSSFSQTLSEVEVFNHLLSSYKPMKNDLYRPTLGIELEGIFPGNNREEAFSAIEEVIKRKIGRMMYPDHQLIVERYSFKTRFEAPRQGTHVYFVNPKTSEKIVWDIKDDGSIHPPEGKSYIGVEIVSPILKTKRDLERYKTLVSELSKVGFSAEPGSAALQMHTGLFDAPLEKGQIIKSEVAAQALLYIWLFSKIERGLMDYYGVAPTRAKYTMPAPAVVIDDIKKGKFDLNHINLSAFLEGETKAQKEERYKYRYWALNPWALFQFGTLEIRFLNSTTQLQYIDALEEMSLIFANGIKKQDAKFVEFFRRHLDKDTIPITELTNGLGVRLRAPLLSLSCQRLFSGGLVP